MGTPALFAEVSISLSSRERPLHDAEAMSSHRRSGERDNCASELGQAGGSSRVDRATDLRQSARMQRSASGGWAGARWHVARGPVYVAKALLGRRAALRSVIPPRVRRPRPAAVRTCAARRAPRACWRRGRAPHQSSPALSFYYPPTDFDFAGSRRCIRTKCRLKRQTMLICLYSSRCSSEPTFVNVLSCSCTQAASTLVICGGVSRLAGATRW